MEATMATMTSAAPTKPSESPPRSILKTSTTSTLTLSEAEATDNDSNSNSNSNNKKSKNNKQNSSSDEPLFGSLATELTDRLASDLTTALRKGIAKLPMLEDGQAQQSLLRQLQQPYWRNLDLLELYCQRNIFSLQNFPPLQRQTIAQIYLDSTWDPSKEQPQQQQEQQEDDDDDEQSQQLVVAPSKDQIPSPSGLQTAQQQLLGRRQHLDALRARRAALERRARELDAARQLVDLAAPALAGAKREDVPRAVAATLRAAAPAAQLGAEGRALQQRMHDLKRQLREENGGHDDGDSDIAVPAARWTKKKKKTVLADRYEENRAALLAGSGGARDADGGTAIGNLDKVRALLRN